MKRNIDSIWTVVEELGLKERDLTIFYNGILKDSGHDLSEVTTSDLDKAIHDNSSAPWKDIGFGCSELISFYLANDKDLSLLQVVQGLIAFRLLAMGTERGVGDWEFEFDKLLEFMLKVREQVSFGIRMEEVSGLIGNS